MRETLELIPDNMLDSLGDFYSSEFVARNMPWIRQMTFEQFLEREIRGGIWRELKRKEGSRW